MSETLVYTVIAIDDHPLFRKGVADLIAMDDTLKLIGEASNGPDGINLALEKKPDLILLDINMKGMSGLEALQQIKLRSLDARVLMLTVSDHEEDVVAALKSGADGYLLKDMEPEDILDCLHQAAHGKVVINERLTQLLARALREEGKDIRSTPSLTVREQQILEKLACGLSNRLIAQELKISEGTVKVHVKNLLKKLNLHSRMEAAVWALKTL